MKRTRFTEEQIIGVSKEHPCRAQDGEPSGINRIHRLYREEGLTVGKRRGRRRAAGNAARRPRPRRLTLAGFWTLSMTSSDVIDDSAS